jgi:hypothetical protein
MPVSAGMVPILGLVAILADVDMATQGLCATLFDGPHGLLMSDGHTGAILLAILRTMAMKNLRQF